MQIITPALTLALALLMWAQPANAQRTYQVSVSVYEDLSLTDSAVRDILEKASRLLQKDHDGPNNDDVACDVTFALKGEVGTFDVRDKVVGDLSIKALHEVDRDLDVDFRVKVVKEIRYCRGRRGQFSGCAFPPEYHQIVVVHPEILRERTQGTAPPDHITWAHELGHVTGLGHRTQELALMTWCGTTNISVQVNQRECNCFLAGPESCPLPPPLWCPQR